MKFYLPPWLAQHDLKVESSYKLITKYEGEVVLIQYEIACSFFVLIEFIFLFFYCSPKIEIGTTKFVVNFFLSSKQILGVE
jgi:hypothetical protein